MRLRDFAMLGIGVMMLFQITTSFASITLLTRMSPAIERILSENVRSNAAVEEMLTCLILEDRIADRRERFRTALSRARENITEPGESALLEAVERHGEAALAGDVRAEAVVSSKLRELSSLNRTSMRIADEEAKRIGNAGAWAMAILGVVGFFAGTLVLRRIARRFISPVEEIRRVLEAQIGGESSRRLSLRNAAPDLRDLGNLVNKLIDHRSFQNRHFRRDVERRALLHLMDQEVKPMALISSDNETLATNRAMDKLLEGEAREAIEAQISAVFGRNASVGDGWTRYPLGDGMMLIREAEAR